MNDAERIADIRKRRAVQGELPETLSTMSDWYAVDVEFLLRYSDQLSAENARLRGPFVWDESTRTYSPAAKKEKQS